MIRDFFSKKGIAKFIDKVRLSGSTIAEHLRENNENTKRAFKNLFKRSVKADLKVEVFAQELEKTAKTRLRHTRNTLKNTLSAVRGQARAIGSYGKKGAWHNVGVLDSATTPVCANYMGAVWHQPYSEIYNKPPRIPPPHPCRSFLVFRKEGDEAPSQESFMDQFDASEDLQREMLGKNRFDAYKKGELEINSFSQYESAVLHTLKELGLK